MKTTGKPLGLYIHIPFCKHKCAYCDFYSLAGSESRMDEYTDTLCAHLTETAPFAAGHLVDTIYFGGAGTLVPITGFANAVVSPAIDFKSEGFVTGMAAKMFLVAGPVIVFGTLASVIYGVVLMLFGLA